MSETVGDFIIERLHAWGVRRIYGYPGDGINGVFGALNRAQAESRKQRNEFEASQDIPSVPYHKFAELIGLKGLYVDDAGQMGAAWDEAFAAGCPVVIEVKADPNIAPLPPHITLAQAKAFASTLMKGDPDQGNVIVETAKQVLGAVLPGHHDK